VDFGKRFKSIILYMLESWFTLWKEVHTVYDQLDPFDMLSTS
jgi:hypothetical protein